MDCDETLCSGKYFEKFTSFDLISELHSAQARTGAQAFAGTMYGHVQEATLESPYSMVALGVSGLR